MFEINKNTKFYCATPKLHLKTCDDCGFKHGFILGHLSCLRLDGRGYEIENILDYFRRHYQREHTQNRCMYFYCPVDKGPTTTNYTIIL